MWRWDPDFREFALHSPLPQLGAALLGADRVSLFYDQAFIKEPGTRSATDWHQDLPFWPALGNDIVSLWVALTPVTVEGSGVEYVAGSHGANSTAPSPRTRMRNSATPSWKNAPISRSSRAIRDTGFCHGNATPGISSAIIRWSSMAPAATRHRVVVPRFRYAMRERMPTGTRART
jgi:hypothetical protein